MNVETGNKGVGLRACNSGCGGARFDEVLALSIEETTAAEKCEGAKLCFSRSNGPIDEAIDQLMELVGGIRHPEIIREMILAALKAGQEGTEKADLKLMLSTLKEMRFSSKVFGPYRQMKKVSIFGSARVQPGKTTYSMARQLGSELARLGCMVITGGGQGIMQAVNEGAGPDRSFGMCIRLPFENQPNYVVGGTPRSITFKYFFNRKVAFIKETDGVVVFPGGFGTMDETMEILTLLQTGKRTPIPLVLIEEPNGTYWSRWIEFLRREMVPRAYINNEDFTLLEKVTTVCDAVQTIRNFYRRYHSMRYVGGRLVIRMSSPLDSRKVDELKRDFEDLLNPGGEMALTGHLPEESDDDIIAHLPRLVLDFNRRSFSRLKQFIDAINTFEDY